MDLSAVQQLANEQTFLAQGTPMSVTLPDEFPVATFVVWDEAIIEDAGRGRQVRRAVWLPTSDVPSAPRGTLLVGPEPHGGDDKTWTVDQTIAVEPGKIQVLVTEVKE